MSREIVNEYEINEDTMAILPYFFADGKIGSFVLESEGEIYVKAEPIDILDLGCRYYGSSFKGRKEGTRQVIRITHKPPIAVSPSKNIYFFPTNSPQQSHCAWLSYKHVTYSEKEGLTKTRITFSNGKAFMLDISKNSLENQYLRTAKLRNVLEHRSGLRRVQNVVPQVAAPNTAYPATSPTNHLLQDEHTPIHSIFPTFQFTDEDDDFF